MNKKFAPIYHVRVNNREATLDMNILLLEDNPDHLQLILEMLEESFGGESKIKCCHLLSDAVAYLESHVVDVFLCDLQLPDSTISETVNRLKELDDAPPIIVLSSLDDGKLAQQLVKDGVQDYLPKSELSPSQLSRACSYAVERKNLNRALHDKNEDYRAFCYSLTHDFRSSLWQIARYSEIFRAQARKHYPEDVSLPWQYLDKIFDRVENIQKLVDDLQDYLALDAAPASFTDFNLSVAVNNAVDMLGETVARRDAVINVHPLPRIYGSVTQMQLLFTNLISNSIKYNDKPSPVVNIEVIEQTEHEVLVSITDNGIGMPTKLLDRIFIPFERLHSKDDYPGSGLGLSIVKRIAQYHGGKITVTSTVGEGTRFCLRLPVADSL